MKTFLFLTLALLFSSFSMAANISGYLGNFNPSVTVTIANAAQSSSLISLNGFALVGIKTPAALTSTAMTFEVCDSAGSNCLPLKVSTSGTALSYTVAVSSYYAIDPAPFQGVQYLKLKAGSVEGGARSLTVSLKGL